MVVSKDLEMRIHWLFWASPNANTAQSSDAEKALEAEAGTAILQNTQCTKTWEKARSRFHGGPPEEAALQYPHWERTSRFQASKMAQETKFALQNLSLE